MGKWGRPGQGRAILKDITDRNFVRIGDFYYPPGSAEALSVQPLRKRRSKIIRTGWIDDSRNLKNREKYQDPFITFVKMELKLDVWPEFYFSTERLYRFDYAIPEHKIAIEVNGGVWAKGKSGHSSGTGILRDYDKSNLAQSLGWRVIILVPKNLMTDESLKILRKYKH
ncbi:hypothetical protein [Sphingobacterium suaedae]|uniref:DUF559 domain-containing protein n=1 Tax=Sphingobacterium suaedae TaxID=1686402 RepID=A0ABW5KFD4_9SPHI